MKRIAFLTVLALTASTAAFAQPYTNHRDESRAVVRVDFNRDRYDRYDRSHWRRDFRGRWVTIARANSARSDRQFIHVDGQRYRKLRIEGVRGQPMVQKIAIEFADGTAQAIDLNARLGNGAGEVIDLNGGVRSINRIIVYTEPRARGSYTLYGA